MYQKHNVSIICVNMSSAFDTNNCQFLLNEMASFLNENEMWMTHIILSETNININFDKHGHETVSPNVGLPQGDVISECFLTKN